MTIFRLAVFVVWAGVVYVTCMALASEGLASASEVFANDVAAMKWPAQFNIDLLAHMALLGFWAAWRQKFSPQGIIFGLLCMFTGSLFSLAYILVLSFYHQGDMRRLVLGKRLDVAV